MKTLITAALLTSVGCACTSSMKKDDSSNIQEVAFACVNGESLSVRFFTMQNKALLIRGGVTIELPQQRSGSGFIYSNGRDTIRGKGGDLAVEAGRMTPLSCKAVNWP